MTFSYLFNRAGYLLPLFFSIISAVDFDILYKRSAIENSYRSAVEFAIARTVDEALFDVNVSVSLIKNPEFIDFQAITKLKAEEEAAETEAREQKEHEEITGAYLRSHQAATQTVLTYTPFCCADY